MRSIGCFQRRKFIFVMMFTFISWCWLKQDNEKLEDFKRRVYIKNMVHTPFNILNQNSSPLSSRPFTYSIRSDYFIPISLKKRDWHNYSQIFYDKTRVGLGEQGKPAYLTAEDDLMVEQIILKTGFNIALSKKISFNRSLPDTRHPRCKNRLYLESLPTVSVIVAVYKEHWSTLLRTVYSILNRSPEYLIKEIFLSCDGSTKEYLKRKFEHYIEKHIPKVKVLRLANHTGLVAARMLGAKAATADVFVFLDAHIEANVNWLPPLLEPIALNYRAVVCPHIDGIDHKNFQYFSNGEGMRGVFDWRLYFMNVPLLPKDEKNMPDPFENPVMMGGMFAISRVFFWELGGYDTGLILWGSEQFEISFKNNRRVADVWMDEYVNFLYARKPEWRNIDPGDLTEQKALRKRLKCKPFKWFMTQIAFDLPLYYPLIERLPFASGQIRPMEKTDVCVTVNGDYWEQVTLMACNKDEEQFFVLNWNGDIRQKETTACWDVPDSKNRGPVMLIFCHNTGGNQLWRYHDVNKTLMHSNSGTCLDYDPQTLELFVNPCFLDPLLAKTQKWIIDNVNKENTVKWEEKQLITGPVEKWTED